MENVIVQDIAIAALPIQNKTISTQKALFAKVSGLHIHVYIYNCCFDVHVTRSISLGDWDISDLA